jgi:hypothetical protein
MRFSIASRHTPEPRAIRIARVLVIVFLALVLFGFFAFNIVRYANAPLIFRATTIESNIYVPSILINVFDKQQGGEARLSCARLVRDVTETLGYKRQAIKLISPAKIDQDFNFLYYVNPPLIPYVSFLLDSPSVLTPWKAFAPTTTCLWSAG